MQIKLIFSTKEINFKGRMPSVWSQVPAMINKQIILKSIYSKKYKT